MTTLVIQLTEAIGVCTCPRIKAIRLDRRSETNRYVDGQHERRNGIGWDVSGRLKMGKMVSRDNQTTKSKQHHWMD